jgi:aldehyde dehydrogenase family 7 protein A1
MYDAPSSSSSYLPAGDPLDSKTLVGPLHTPGAVELYERTLRDVQDRGGKVITARQGKLELEGFPEGTGGNWVWPVVVKPKGWNDPCWREE